MALGIDVNDSSEIQYAELIDINKDICKGLIFIYSMETFVAYKMNEASRSRDESKVQTFGPFSYALCRVASTAQNRRKDRLNSVNQ